MVGPTANSSIFKLFNLQPWLDSWRPPYDVTFTYESDWKKSSSILLCHHVANYQGKWDFRDILSMVTVSGSITVCHNTVGCLWIRQRMWTYDSSNQVHWHRSRKCQFDAHWLIMHDSFLFHPAPGEIESLLPNSCIFFSMGPTQESKLLITVFGVSMLDQFLSYKVHIFYMSSMQWCTQISN